MGETGHVSSGSTGWILVEQPPNSESAKHNGQDRDQRQKDLGFCTTITNMFLCQRQIIDDVSLWKLCCCCHVAIKDIHEIQDILLFIQHFRQFLKRYTSNIHDTTLGSRDFTTRNTPGGTIDSMTIRQKNAVCCTETRIDLQPVLKVFENLSNTSQKTFQGTTIQSQKC